MIPQELLTEIFVLLVQVIILVLGGFIINFLRISIGKDKFNYYHSLAKTVINSIEQTFGGGNGADKKEEAIQAIKSITKGKLSNDQIERIIEASVFEMNILLKANSLK
jgi:LL-H family phage holin